MLARTPLNNHSVNNLHQSKRSAPNSNQIPNTRPSKPIKPNSNYRECVFQHERVYGFKLTGNAPVRVQFVKIDCLAWKSGLRENDIIRKVNDIPVLDKQNEYVNGLLRKHSTIRLLVESDNVRNNTSTNNSSLKPRTSSHGSPRTTVIRDSNPQKPKILPGPITKPIPIPRPKSIANPEHVPEKSIPHQPIRHHAYASPRVTNQNREHIGKYDPTRSSSESSTTTSSSGSDMFQLYANPHSIPPQVRSLPNNTLQTQPIPHNVPFVKKRPIPIPPQIPKNKTIPTDDVKSYKVTTDNVNDAKLNEKARSNTLPKKTTNGRIHGREFDDDSQDEDDSDNSLSLIKMLKSTMDTLFKPDLVATLLNYVKEKPIDIRIMIFFYCCKLYQSQSLNREFLADAPRMANEIISTFLHEKSPLNININTDIVLEILKNIKIKEKLSTLFDVIMEKVFEIIKNIVADVRGKLERGIQLPEDVTSSVNAFNTMTNQDRELSSLFKSICNILTRSQKDSNSNDSVTATEVGLATMYQYFHGTIFVPGTNFRARSTDCINKANSQHKSPSISEYFKIPILCANIQLKSSQSFRKKSKTVSGHVLIEAVCTEPEECAICGNLLWGVAPQGLYCTMCSTYYHLKCKKKIKVTCSRKLRKSNSQINKEEKPPFLERLIRKSSTNSVRSPVSAEISNNGGNHFFGSVALLPDDKISTIQFNGVLDISKSNSADQLNRSATAPSQFDRIGSSYNIIRSSISQTGDIDQKNNDSALVDVQELVDISLIDPDMKIDDSFDADAEINAVFPKLTPGSDKRILIVLLEFYHKTRYILMNLKRYKYSIVQKWPQSQNVYIKALSLDCIAPLVDLIKSLVLTIEQCITEQKFVGLAEAVLHWLSENDDERLKTWLTLSSNLCCTNSLNAVKQLKQNSLAIIPELANIMKVKFNKRIMIDELAQIRPLLISLPFITKNIIKSLSKEETKYLEDISLWKQISTKMDYLVEYIDRCCIPLVDKINNGIILRRADKFDGQLKWKDSENDIKEYCNDFPRTFFHFLIFDFQIAKVFDWTTNTERSTTTDNDGESRWNERLRSNTLPKKMDLQTTYFKKGTEVLIIIYKTFIAVLQKENEHFILKPIKSLKAGFEKKHPIITISSDNIFKDGQQEENQFVLNVISTMKGNVLLVRIGFSSSEILYNLLDFINKKKYDLGKSLNLFKNNEFAMLTESLTYLDRNPSTMSTKSKQPIDNIDFAALSNDVPETEVKDLELPSASYVALSKALTTASDVLESQALLSAILNVSEGDLQSKIQIINDDGVKSLEELLVLLYTLSQSTIQQTQKLLTTCCPKLNGTSDFDAEEVKRSLTKTHELIDNWDKSRQVIEEISPEVVMRLKSTNRKSEYEVYNEDLIPVVDLEEGNSNDIEDDVPVIVDGTVEDSVDQVRSSSELRESYKYEPSESRLPDVITDLVPILVPNDRSQIDETIIIRRSQIIVHNRNSCYSTV